ncbi:hypothetical protein Dimus_012767 [Dionaea muscipula]
MDTLEGEQVKVGDDGFPKDSTDGSHWVMMMKGKINLSHNLSLYIQAGKQGVVSEPKVREPEDIARNRDTRKGMQLSNLEDERGISCSPLRMLRGNELIGLML